MKYKEIALVALGGNAITGVNDTGDIHEQFANTRKSLSGIILLLKKGYRLIITHGNGPQIGNALIRVEESVHLVPSLPLGVLVADLQGGIGYMIEQSLQNRLMREGMKMEVVTIITQVIVDRNDPAIIEPSKPIGPFISENRVEEFKISRNWVIKGDINRGYRRVVPSPKPLKTINSGAIKNLVDLGYIVVACGGGGIPVYIEKDKTYEGIDAVIDKDLGSAVLAAEICAENLIILTEVEKVALNFMKENQIYLETVKIKEIEKYYQEGHFPKGSMGPKIEAAIDFIKKGGKRVLITSFDALPKAIEGNNGTWIIPD